jgi:hypothetical protein
LQKSRLAIGRSRRGYAIPGRELRLHFLNGGEVKGHGRLGGFNSPPPPSLPGSSHFSDATVVRGEHGAEAEVATGEDDVLHDGLDAGAADLVGIDEFVP